MMSILRAECQARPSPFERWHSFGKVKGGWNQGKPRFNRVMQHGDGFFDLDATTFRAVPESYNRLTDSRMINARSMW